MVAASLLITTLLLTFAIAIAAKPASILERKSPIKLPLTRRRSFASYNIVERDRRQIESLRRRAGNQDDSDLGPESNNTPATYRGADYFLTIGVGNPPTFCKWLKHLVADEKNSTASFFADKLQLDAARWAGNVQLLPGMHGSNEILQLEHLGWKY